MYRDQEINALSNVYEALKKLNNAQIKRIIDWVTSKFGLDDQTGLREVQPEVAESTGPAMVEPIQPPVEPVKKRRGRRPRQAQAVFEEPQAVASGLKGFMKYDSIKEIFAASTAKRLGAKILLAAAYLQEKENLKELSSYDISSRLRKIGEDIKNPSAAINGLMGKKPPLLLQTGTQGTSKKSRRKFRVTEEGLKIARNYISE